MKLQVSSYASMLSGMTGESVDEAYVVMLRDDQARGYKVKDIRGGLDSFHHAYGLQNGLAGGGPLREG